MLWISYLGQSFKQTPRAPSALWQWLEIGILIREKEEYPLQLSFFSLILILISSSFFFFLRPFLPRQPDCLGCADSGSRKVARVHGRDQDIRKIEFCFCPAGGAARAQASPEQAPEAEDHRLRGLSHSRRCGNPGQTREKAQKKWRGNRHYQLWRAGIEHGETRGFCRSDRCQQQQARKMGRKKEKDR